jgi:hypothetical protein
MSPVHRNDDTLRITLEGVNAGYAGLLPKIARQLQTSLDAARV